MPRLMPTWSAGGQSFKPPRRVATSSPAPDEGPVELGGGPSGPPPLLSSATGSIVGSFASSSGNGLTDGSDKLDPPAQRVSSGRFANMQSSSGGGAFGSFSSTGNPARSAERPKRPAVNVVKLSKEDLLARRHNTSLLPELEPLAIKATNLISEQALLPVSLVPLDPAEVDRLWAAGSAAARSSSTPGTVQSRSSSGGMKNGIGIGAGRKWDRDGGEGGRRPSDDPWDDSEGLMDGLGGGGMMDLADMAAQSDKFKLEMDRMAQRVAAIEASESREQEERKARIASMQQRAQDQQAQQSTAGESEQEPEPEWASAPLPTTSPAALGVMPSQGNNFGAYGAGVHSSESTTPASRDSILSALGIMRAGTAGGSGPSSSSAAMVGNSHQASSGTASQQQFSGMSMRGGEAPSSLQQSAEVQRQMLHDRARAQEQVRREQAAQVQEQAARAREQAQAQAIALQQQQQQQQQPTPTANLPWFYLDPQGNVQGPFQGQEMRQWLEAGYFRQELPIRRGSAVGDFVELQRLFPNLADAFIEPPHQQHIQQQQRDRALVQQQQQQVAAAQAQARALAQAQAQARAQAQAQAQSEAQMRQEQARREQVARQAQERQAREELEARQQEATEHQRREQGRQRAQAMERAQAEQQAAALRKAQEMAQAPPPPPEISPWAIGGDSPQTRSLAEIQAEEARARARAEAQRAHRESTQSHPTHAEIAASQGASGNGQWMVHGQPAGGRPKSGPPPASQAPPPSPPRDAEGNTPGPPAPVPLMAAASPLTSKNLSQKERKALEKRMKAQAVAAAQQPPALAWSSSGGSSGGQGSASAQLRSVLGMPPGQSSPAAGASTPQTQAWSGPAARPKSLLEIQEEEARLASERAKQAGPAATGWAAKVSPNAGLAPPTAPSQQRAVSGGGGGSGQAWAGRVSAQQPVKSQAEPMPTISQQADGFWDSQEPEKSSPAGTAGPEPTFGSQSIPPEMQPWATQQMMKLSGSSELALLDFCMNLKDASEVRQYLAEYLGYTPHVSSFATEFLNRRANLHKGGSANTSGSAGQGENWAPAASKRKHRKNKSG